MIDLLPYLRSAGKPYYFQRSWAGVAVAQHQPETVRWYEVEGPEGQAAQWRELWADDAYIYRGQDATYSDNEYYSTEQEGRYGHRWLKRRMAEGDVHSATVLTKFRRKESGTVYQTSASTWYLQLYKIHPTWKTPAGQQLNDVVEIRGYAGNPLQGAESDEWYFYQPDYGLVGWHKPSQGQWSYYVSDAEAVPTRGTWSGVTVLPESALPRVQVTHPLPTTGYIPLMVRGRNSQGTPVRVNVRAGRSTDAEILWHIGPEWAPISLYPDAKTENGIVWVAVLGPAGSGWAASNFLQVELLPTPEPEPEPEPEPPTVPVDPVGLVLVDVQGFTMRIPKGDALTMAQILRKAADDFEQAAE